MCLVLGSMLIAGMLLFGACEPGLEDQYSGARSAWIDLEGIPLSDELRPWVEAYSGSVGHAREASRERDLRIRNRLQAAIENPDLRDSAGDTLYEYWRSDPTNFLWIDMAIVNDYLLRRSDDRDLMFAVPELADTSSGAGAFAYAREHYRYTAGPEVYARVAARTADLDSLQRAWLTIRLAAVDSDTGSHLGAVSRLLEDMDLAHRNEKIPLIIS